MQCSFYKVKKELNIIFSIYIYIRSFTFFAKECCVLLHSLQKNVVLRSFGFHKSPKTQKKRKRTLHSLIERKRTERSEQKRTWCPTLLVFSGVRDRDDYW